MLRAYVNRLEEVRGTGGKLLRVGVQAQLLHEEVSDKGWGFAFDLDEEEREAYGAAAEGQDRNQELRAALELRVPHHHAEWLARHGKTPVEETVTKIEGLAAHEKFGAIPIDIDQARLRIAAREETRRVRAAGKVALDSEVEKEK